MDSWITDLRYGFRTLIRRPIITGVAILSIALGVGANGAVFSLVNGLLLRPPRGVEAPDELVRIYQLRKSFDWPLGVSVPDFRDSARRRRAGLVDRRAHLRLLRSRARRRAADAGGGSVVVGDYFATLGMQPALGRLFGSAEDDAREPVVVAAHDFWLDQLGGDPQAIGRAVVIDGQTFTSAASPRRLRRQRDAVRSRPLDSGAGRGSHARAARGARLDAAAGHPRLREGVERRSSRSGSRRCRPRSPPNIPHRTKATCSTPCPTPTPASKRDWAAR